MLCPYYYYGYRGFKGSGRTTARPYGLGFGRFGWLGDSGQAEA